MGQVLLVTTVFAVMLVAVGGSSAIAQPMGGYAAFAQCPTSTAKVRSCVVTRTESGEIKVGSQSVPIVNTQTLQGGLINLNEYEKQLVAAKNGESLTKTAQKVPGGLLDIKCSKIRGSVFIEKGLRGSCEKFFENSLTNVYATTELAGPASSVILSQVYLLFGVGSALTLPVKIKLENPLLGSDCYIGSDSEPIKLELTSGASGSLIGIPGTINTKEEGGLLVLGGNKLVESNFKAPGATGCGLFGLLDPLINAKLGLPATTGNTAVFSNTIEVANSELVAASE